MQKDRCFIAFISKYRRSVQLLTDIQGRTKKFVSIAATYVREIFNLPKSHTVNLNSESERISQSTLLTGNRNNKPKIWRFPGAAWSLWKRIEIASAHK